MKQRYVSLEARHRRSDCFDALVAGGGPAGSATAILLARAGWRVVLAEKRRFPRRKVCGECLAASNLPLLYALGVGESFDEAAGPELQHVSYLQGAHSVSAALPAARAGQFRWGKAIGRETLDLLLLERARAVGVQVMQPCTLQSISGKAGDWQCSLRLAERESSSAAAAGTAARETAIELCAREIIDAHGSWEPMPCIGSIDNSTDNSTDRNRTVSRSASDLLAFKANFRNATFKRGHIGVIALDGAYGGIVEAEGGITTVACCVRRDRLEALRSASTGERAGEVIEAWLKSSCAVVDGALAMAHREGSWLAAGPIRPGIRLGRSDGIYRVGNAAGEAHPILGEGMSMALQGAALLADALLQPGLSSRGERVSARHREALQRRYTRSWQHRFAPRLWLAALFAHASMHPGSAARCLQLAGVWPGLLTHGARLGGKTASLPRSLSLHRAGTPGHLHRQAGTPEHPHRQQCDRRGSE